MPSAPLVPHNDPTLMFVNAGMVPFKNVFTGLETRPYNRATSSQKCVRAGGKHNDLDNVGYTVAPPHLLRDARQFLVRRLFQGPAIELAWNLLTKEWGLSPDRLTATVYHTDDEAFDLWKKIAGLPEEPHHPHPDQGQFLGDGRRRPVRPMLGNLLSTMATISRAARRASPDEDGDRFVEIWNLVFMQFEQAAGEIVSELPKKSIDTGMGLERIAAVLQGTTDNYETDTFKALIHASEELTRTRAEGEQQGQPPGHRRPFARFGLPRRRRRPAGQRGPGLCPPPDHAPRHAPRAYARRQGAADAPPGAGSGRRNGRRLPGAGPRPAADRGDAGAGGSPLPPDAGQRPEAARRSDRG